MKISKEAFNFLKDLSKNNNREWFNKRKPIFKDHEKGVKLFFKEIEDQLQQTDKIEDHRLFRIYRDVRFSKDKSPYKTSFTGGFKRATAELRGGYYLKIEPGNSMAGGGFYAPNKEDLQRFREEFEYDDSKINKITNRKAFKNAFGQIEGSGLKTAPRGFDPTHKSIDLIKKKQFYVSRTFTDKEVLADDFAEKVIETYKTLRPFFDYMSEIVTTNKDGESII
jgi:uncharacterized protein (TIGR02453 family)